MISYSIEGSVRNADVVDYFVIKLLKSLKLDKLRKPTIEIVFCNNIQAFGLCSGDREHVTIEIAKKCPNTGRKLTFCEMMRVLAHEMVHAKQFLRGELSGDGQWSWKGRNAAGYKYDNQPWEKEAYRLEKTLFAECFPFFMPFKN